MNHVTLVQKNAEKKLITPSKIICIGRNYVEHIQELGNEIPDEMVVFLKPNSAISQQLNSEHNGDVLHYEAELCFLYQAGQFTALALGLDLTKRSVQTRLKAKGLPWERAKAFDGSALFSDFVSITCQDISQLALSLHINQQVIQHGGVDLMMVKPDEILTDLQSFMSLEDGDIVMTGTPKGVGTVKVKDEFLGSVYSAEEALLTCQWQAK